jgi:hypothetical protein
VVPSIFAVVSGAQIAYAVRRLPRMIAGYGHLFQGGDRWIHPGSAMYGLAAIANGLTQPWVAMWNPAFSGRPISDTIVNDLMPLAIVVFGVAIAVLLRRVDLPAVSERLATTTVTMLGILIGALLIAYVAWLEFGGPSGSQTFWPIGPVGSGVYLVFLALVAVLLTRTGILRSRRSRSVVVIFEENGSHGHESDPQPA